MSGKDYIYRGYDDKGYDDKDAIKTIQTDPGVEHQYQYQVEKPSENQNRRPPPVPIDTIQDVEQGDKKVARYRKAIIILVVLLLIAIILGLGIGLGLKNRNSNSNQTLSISTSGSNDDADNISTQTPITTITLFSSGNPTPTVSVSSETSSTETPSPTPTEIECDPFAAPTIENGDFEDDAEAGEIAPWYIAGIDENTSWAVEGSGGGKHVFRAYCTFGGGSKEFARIKLAQELKTCPGVTYDIKFDHMFNGGSNDNAFLEVFVAGDKIFSLQAEPYEWIIQNDNFVAENSTTLLQLEFFTKNQDSQTFYVDSFVITPRPV